jgi:hypothetical protein
MLLRARVLVMMRKMFGCNKILVHQDCFCLRVQKYQKMNIDFLTMDTHSLLYDPAGV